MKNITSYYRKTKKLSLKYSKVGFKKLKSSITELIKQIGVHGKPLLFLGVYFILALFLEPSGNLHYFVLPLLLLLWMVSPTIKAGELNALIARINQILELELDMSSGEVADEQENVGRQEELESEVLEGTNYDR